MPGQAHLLGMHEAGGFFLTPLHPQQTWQGLARLWQAPQGLPAPTDPTFGLL